MEGKWITGGTCGIEGSFWRTGDTKTSRGTRSFQPKGLESEGHVEDLRVRGLGCRRETAGLVVTSMGVFSFTCHLQGYSRI